MQKKENTFDNFGEIFCYGGENYAVQQVTRTRKIISTARLREWRVSMLRFVHQTEAAK